MTPIGVTCAVMKLGGLSNNPVDARQIAERLSNTPRHLISNALSHAHREFKFLDRWKGDYTTTAKGRQAVKDALNSPANRALATAIRDGKAGAVIPAMPARADTAFGVPNEPGPQAILRAAALLALDARSSGTTSEIGQEIDCTHKSPHRAAYKFLSYFQRAGFATSVLRDTTNKMGRISMQRIYTITKTGSEMAVELRRGVK
jgi:hypothetical protein